MHMTYSLNRDLHKVTLLSYMQRWQSGSAHMPIKKNARWVDFEPTNLLKPDPHNSQPEQV